MKPIPALCLIWVALSSHYLAATPNASNAESVLELTYHAPISENFHLQPDLQWIFDAHESRDDVFVLGLRIGFDY
jgi:carbohydrate-selective porin OprB